MFSKIIVFPILISIILILTSCGHVTNRMSNELADMHDYLTEKEQADCYKYNYNFQRKTPRLYDEKKLDSINSIFEYIKDECGPSTGLETARLLILTEQGKYDDSLIGEATIPQMLWLRSSDEFDSYWLGYRYAYGFNRPIDNSSGNFDIYYRFFNYSSQSWNETKSMTSYVTDEQDPTVAVDDNLNVWVVWVEDVSVNGHLIGRKYNSSTNVQADNPNVLRGIGFKSKYIFISEVENLPADGDELKVFQLISPNILISIV